MRFQKIQDFLKEHKIPYTYSESNGSGAIEFVQRGLSYHIWEYPEPERGASSNVRTCGKMEDFEDEYEKEILTILESWYQA